MQIDVYRRLPETVSFAVGSSGNEVPLLRSPRKLGMSAGETFLMEDQSRCVSVPVHTAGR